MNWNEIVQNYIIKYADQIKKVTLPLKDHFAITYFTYHRIDLQGNYTVLINRPDWAENYVQKKFFLEDPFLNHPDHFQEGFIPVETVLTDETPSILVDAKKILRADQGVTWVHKQADCVEFFGFGGQKGKCALDLIASKNPHLLQSFAQHFKKQLNIPLRHMQQETSPLSLLKGNFAPPAKEPFNPFSLKNLCDYLEKIGFQQEVARFKSLTRREKDCLRLLLQGKTAKETALLLAISPRTIESYFESMKAKLGCSYKAEIFTYLKKLEAIGLRDF